MLEIFIIFGLAVLCFILEFFIWNIGKWLHNDDGVFFLIACNTMFITTFLFKLSLL